VQAERKGAKHDDIVRLLEGRVGGADTNATDGAAFAGSSLELAPDGGPRLFDHTSTGYELQREELRCHHLRRKADEAKVSMS
jgi:hypothetical protein